MGRSRTLTVALEVVARGVARETLLTRVAEVVAELPPGEGVLVEGTLDDAPLTLLPAGARATATLGTVVDEAGGALVAGRPPAAPAPGGGGGEERWGALVDAPAPRPPAEARAPPAPGGPPDAPPEPGPRLIGPAVGLAVQSHWVPGTAGRIAAATRYRLWAPRGRADADAARAGATIAGGLGGTARVAWRRSSWTTLRRWGDGRPSSPRRVPWRTVAPRDAPALVAPVVEAPFPSSEELGRHLVLLGASGSGKTSLLVRLAAGAVRRGEAVVVVDLHGDVGPALFAMLGPTDRARCHVLDPSVGDGRGPGIAVLAGGGPDDRTRAHVVAALKRLSPDGETVYWGFRIERIIETLVQAVQEEGGTLLDLYDLLTDADRREATRLATREPAVARFLAELPALLRRNPEFLGPATARLHRLALSPRLAALLAPAADAAVPVPDLVRAGGTLVLRLPLAALGPEAAGFAATLLLTRLYLDLAARAPTGPVRLLLDEAQAISPPLLSEILAEGRKFGLTAALATQYPDRLAPELRAAAGGAAGTHVVFRLPAPAARAGASWAGLSPRTAASLLPRLTDGWGILASGGRTGPRLVWSPPLPPPAPPDAWAEAVARTRSAFGGPNAPADLGLGPAEEALLLHLLGAGRPVPTDRLLRSVAGALSVAPAELLERLGGLARAGLVGLEDGTAALRAAGALRLGARAEHGSSVEGLEHRQLLLEAFRIFASRGERVELLRQGRFDTRLPDGRLRLLPPGAAVLPPRELARLLARRATGWAWRHFDGRDVHLEAEVSGAERPERIRRGLQKAEAAGAVVVFLVGDARRARRLRAILGRLGADPRRARVWTLARARLRHPLDP